MRQGGLADPRNILDQQVAARQQTGDAVAYLGLFTHNHRVKLTEQTGELRGDVHFCIHMQTIP